MKADLENLLDDKGLEFLFHIWPLIYAPEENNIQCAVLVGFLLGIVNMKFELDSECDFLLRIMVDQTNEF